MQRLLPIAAALSVALLVGCGTSTRAAKPVSGKEWQAVLTDWLSHGRFTQVHSCAAVVVTRAKVVPVFKEGTPLVHALDLYEHSQCRSRGDVHRVRIGMSDRDVVRTGGAPVPWLSGPHCWTYRGRSFDAVTFCFSRSAHVSHIAWASHG
jgi:hypothetical protein